MWYRNIVICWYTCSKFDQNASIIIIIKLLNGHDFTRTSEERQTNMVISTSLRDGYVKWEAKLKLIINSRLWTGTWYDYRTASWVYKFDLFLKQMSMNQNFVFLSLTRKLLFVALNTLRSLNLFFYLVHSKPYFPIGKIRV